MGGYVRAEHGFGPVYDERSRILILGSFPSVKSREGEFYYHHPQNRFWKVLCALYEEPFPETIPERRAMLLRNRIALWDVIERCDIVGSSDGSIRNAEPVDLSVILSHAPIERVYGNGTKACQMYRRFHEPIVGRTISPLPSTSPANAAWSLERLIEAWKQIII